MGREHRLPRNPRLREEGDRRQAGISTALPEHVARYRIDGRRPITGIDVGEDFLDLATIDSIERRLRFERIAIAGNGTDPIAHIAEEIARRVPELLRDGIALVDSPRAPRNTAHERGIDSALRELIARVNQSRAPDEQITLSLFPTPQREYFLRCAADPRCKPHLAEFARELAEPLWSAGVPAGDDARILSRTTISGGGLFTRFMLAGFATFRALEQHRIESFESYPYLAFSLWKLSSELLPPKSKKRAALAARGAILARLCRAAAVRMPTPISLDQADAAAMAITTFLSTVQGFGALAIEGEEEGRFLFSLS